MTTTAQKIAEATAPKSWGRDRPGAPARIAQMQTPSDRLREHARRFMQVSVGLVPVPQFHNVLVAVVGDLVDVGERALKGHLELQPEWTRDGFEVQGKLGDGSRLGALLNDTSAGADAAVDTARKQVEALEVQLRDMQAGLELAAEEQAALQSELDAVRAELEEVKASRDPKATEEARIAAEGDADTDGAAAG